MRILFAGTPEVAVIALRELLVSEHEVAAVLTRPEAPSGRGRKPTPSPVALAAVAAGIPVLTPASLASAEVRAEILGLGVEAAAVVAYGALVPRALLEAFPWINLHFSLLPRWRGAAPVQCALAAGDSHTGATTFLLEETLDTGPILGRLTHPLAGTESAGELLEALARRGAPLLVQALSDLAAGAQPEPQDQQGATYAPKVTTAQAQVAWSASSAVIERRIRANTPAPGPWTTTGSGLRVRLGPVRVLGATELPAPLRPGEVYRDKKSVVVGTGDGAVQLGQVAPPGKKWMDAAAWCRGIREEIGFVEL